MEDAFFFDGPNGRLFGVLHRPENACSTGIVFCSAFVEEKLWAHRVFVRFARLLAQKGVAVLRFDYMGTGDSQGESEDATVETHLADIAAAVQELRERGHVRTVGLLGLRFGATLALLAARRPPPSVDFLVLWEPILKGEEYLQKCLRSHLATQMAAYKKILKTRNQILADVAEGRAANIEGYLISPELFRQAQAIDLTGETANGPRQPVLVVAVTPKTGGASSKQLERFFQDRIEKRHPCSRFLVAMEEPFWNELKTHYEEAPDLFEKTLAWVCEGLPEEACARTETASFPTEPGPQKACCCNSKP